MNVGTTNARAVSDEEDRRHMARALELSAHGLYSTHPNPRVGCVLVRAGEVVGEGWHERAGGPHAEVHALRAAGERARGATAYVTLEPCSHHGRTPPCADALIAAGVARVVYACGDPFPLVNGGGAAKLRAAGIAVEEGCLRAEAEALNAGFLSRVRGGRPYVRVKLAASLDGRTALANGESRWITGEAARADVQKLRARSSAIVTGAATVLRDDPQLTVRDASLATLGRQPLRVVLDPGARVRASARLFRESGPVLVVHASLEDMADAKPIDALRAVPIDEPHGMRVDARHGTQVDALHAAGAEVVRLPAPHGAFAPAEVLAELARRHANEVLVEAGARLAGAFLAARCVDELVVYLAPHLLGHDAAPLVVLPRIESMAERTNLALRDVTQLGPDLRLTLVPA
jgi:diaminohydroxyphosphoribosylaminopyrimidine deaminase/5-amino-6-(5-phosphoribosylamino)uracil reductase